MATRAVMDGAESINPIHAPLGGVSYTERVAEPGEYVVGVVVCSRVTVLEPVYDEHGLASCGPEGLTRIYKKREANQRAKNRTESRRRRG